MLGDKLASMPNFPLEKKNIGFEIRRYLWILHFPIQFTIHIPLSVLVFTVRSLIKFSEQIMTIEDVLKALNPFSSFNSRIYLKKIYRIKIAGNKIEGDA